MYFALSALCVTAGIQICRKKKSATLWAVASMVLAVFYAALMTAGGAGSFGVRYLVQSLGYTGIWWTYLVTSKRVKATLVL